MGKSIHFLCQVAGEAKPGVECPARASFIGVESVGKSSLICSLVDPSGRCKVLPTGQGACTSCVMVVRNADVHGVKLLSNGRDCSTEETSIQQQLASHMKTLWSRREEDTRLTQSAHSKLDSVLLSLETKFKSFAPNKVELL